MLWLQKLERWWDLDHYHYKIYSKVRRSRRKERSKDGQENQYRDARAQYMDPNKRGLETSFVKPDISEF